MAAVGLEEQVRQGRRRRCSLTTVNSLGLREQRLWAAGVLAVDPPAEQQQAWRILREWDTEREQGLRKHLITQPQVPRVGATGDSEAWWRGASVDREEAALALYGLLLDVRGGKEAYTQWCGSDKNDGAAPREKQWRRWVERGRCSDQLSGGAERRQLWCSSGAAAVDNLLGAAVWKGSNRVPQWKADVEVQSQGLKQWVRWGVLLGKCKVEAVVGAATAQELDLEVDAGGQHAWINVWSAGGNSRWKARISTEDADGVWAPHNFLSEWAPLVTPAPTQFPGGA